MTTHQRCYAASVAAMILLFCSATPVDAQDQRLTTCPPPDSWYIPDDAYLGAWFSHVIGDASALHAIGMALRDGRYAYNNATAARPWFTCAAQLGYVPSYLELGGLYEAGSGVEKAAWFKNKSFE